MGRDAARRGHSGNRPISVELGNLDSTTVSLALPYKLGEIATCTARIARLANVTSIRLIVKGLGSRNKGARESSNHMAAQQDSRRLGGTPELLEQGPDPDLKHDSLNPEPQTPKP